MPIVITSRATVPSAPTLTSVTPGDSGAAAAWEASSGASVSVSYLDTFDETFTPAFGSQVVTEAAGTAFTDGGSPLIRWVLEARVAATGVLALSVSAGPDATDAVLRPLTNGVQYSVTLTAVNGIGSSVPSAAVLVTPIDDGGPIDPNDPDGPDVYVPVAQPLLAAFPSERLFRPVNWLLSAEEADAR